MVSRLNHKRTTVIAVEPGRYLSFPDVIKVPSGKLLCAYRNADIHYPPHAATTELILIESKDGGKTWGNERIFAQGLRERNSWCWHCPRFSLLSDNRLALICDLVHPLGGGDLIYLSFSEDEGETWSTPIDTGAEGIVPDRLIELGPREWIFACHYPGTSRRTLSERIFATEDGGESWVERGIIEDERFHYAEASLVPLGEQRLVAYLRENSFLHVPTLVSYSSDGGRSWSTPQFHPTHAHRPAAGLISENEVLITYRDVTGNPGLLGWIGTPDESGWEPAMKDLSGDEATLTAAGLRIAARARGRSGVHVSLFPILDLQQEFSISARMRRLEGEQNSAVMVAMGCLYILADRIEFLHQPNADEPERRESFGSVSLDTTISRLYSIEYRNSALTVSVNGSKLLEGKIGSKPGAWQHRVGFGNKPCETLHLVGFEEHRGESVWESVEFRTTTSRGEDIICAWQASDRRMPDYYQRERTFRIDSETSGDLAESGYSGWTRLDQSHVYCVDYRRNEADKPYIVGHLLEISRG